MLGMVKGLMVTSLGIGGIGGVTYGIVKASSSPSAGKPIKKVLKLSSSGPILVCKNGGEEPSYEIDLGLAGNDVELQIWKIKKTDSGQERVRIVLSPSSEIYTLMLMLRNNEKINEINIKTLKDATSQGNGKTITCSESKIVSIKGHTGGFDITHPELIISPCKPTLGNSKQKECDIKFREVDHLRWSSDFQPKVTYTTI